METTNGHIFTPEQQKTLDFYASITKQQDECSICKRRGDKDAMVQTYATPAEQSLKFATLAHPTCADKRKADIASFFAAHKEAK